MGGCSLADPGLGRAICPGDSFEGPKHSEARIVGCITGRVFSGKGLEREENLGI